MTARNALGKVGKPRPKVMDRRRETNHPVSNAAASETSDSTSLNKGLADVT